MHRTQPLTDVHALLADAEAELSRQWDAGHVLRWQRVEGGAPAVADGAPAADGVAADGEAGGEAGAGAPDAHIDLSALRSAGELEAALGAERLKRELGMRGLKCGGRPAERAQRLFLALTAPEQLDRKQYAHAAVAQPAAAHGGASNGNGACVHDGVGVSAAAAASAAASAHARRCASIEAAIVRLGEVLGQTPAETAANVEKVGATDDPPPPPPPPPARARAWHALPRLCPLPLPCSRPCTPPLTPTWPVPAASRGAERRAHV